MITEFRNSWPDQSAPFRAEIHFIDPSERRKILAEHFKDFFNVRIKPPSHDEEDVSDDSEPCCITADDYFASLFADRAEFSKGGYYDQDKFMAYFSSAKAADDGQVLAELARWIDELLSRFVSEDSSARQEASTSKELVMKLQPFIAAASADDPKLRIPSLWPIVRSVE